MPTKRGWNAGVDMEKGRKKVGVGAGERIVFCKLCGNKYFVSMILKEDYKEIPTELEASWE